MGARATRENDRPEPPRNSSIESPTLQPFARPFVALVLAVFVVCGLFGIEAWPFSGFRLFSAPRLPTWSSFHAEVVSADGRATRLRISSLPAAYRGFGLVAARLPSRSEPHRLAVCRVYADAAATVGASVDELRIYRVDHVTIPREGGRPATPVTSTLITRCAPSDVP